MARLSVETDVELDDTADVTENTPELTQGMCNFRENEQSLSENHQHDNSILVQT
jgi:hypothetical protein